MMRSKNTVSNTDRGINSHTKRPHDKVSKGFSHLFLLKTAIGVATQQKLSIIQKTVETVRQFLSFIIVIIVNYFIRS